MMPNHCLTNFKKQIHYQNKCKFKSIYSRNNLPKIKDGVYVVNLDYWKSIGTHWITLNVNDNNIACFDSF